MNSPSTLVETTNFRVWLQKQFTDRCRRNESFSLRSFARILAMDPSTVSQILAGKRNVSKKAITKICDRLSASPQVRQKFASQKTTPEAALPEISYELLTADAFAVVADWHHYAILELTFVKGFQGNPRWIASKLGISPAEAAVAVERLERLELLERVKGRLVKTNTLLTNFTDGFTAPALREFQRQILRKALHAIDYSPPEEKDITSMTMAVNLRQLPAARQLIKKFRRELCAFLEKGPRERVYHLGVQLYPVSAAGPNQTTGETHA